LSCSSVIGLFQIVISDFPSLVIVLQETGSADLLARLSQVLWPPFVNPAVSARLVSSGE